MTLIWPMVLMLKLQLAHIKVRENRREQSRMNNRETLATLGTRHRTKWNKTKTNQHLWYVHSFIFPSTIND